MNKQDIVKSLRKQANGADFVTKAQVSRTLGIDRHTAARYLEGLDRIDGKLYFVGDVAARILQRLGV